MDLGSLQKNATVVREDGVRGRIVEARVSGEPSPRLSLLFDDGVQAVVGPTALVAQADGTYLVPGNAMRVIEGAATTATGEFVIPVVAEEFEVETRRVARGTVHVNKRVETREEVVNIPVVNEEVVVEHVPVNAVVEGKPPEVRHEGDVMIIPVLEEVVVTEKRLMLREVVRVTKKRVTTQTEQTVSLRREVVDVERVAAEDAAPAVADPAPSRRTSHDS
jgi:uncharacterized protein (TIGR02271 family)